MSPNKKSIIQGSTTFYFMIPLIIGLHVGWFALQQHNVPVSERHDHPLVKLYKKFTT